MFAYSPPAGESGEIPIFGSENAHAAGAVSKRVPHRAKISAPENGALMTYKNNDNLNDLISEAGKKSGVDPKVLKNTIDSGKLDELLSRMSPKDAEKFRQIVSNPQLAQQMLNTPQAKLLIKQFIK